MRERLKVPHTLVLLYAMIVLAYILTWLLPAGAFDTTTNDHGREVVLPGTYSVLTDVEPLPIWSVFTVIPRGLEAAQGIIFFIFLIGGALAVVRKTGVIDAFLAQMLDRFGNRPAWLIFFSMLVVAVGASTIGMSEEFIPFTPILIILCLGLRMDAIVAAGVLVIGSGIGYGAAAINPFTVVVAQEVAGLPLLSGLEYRLMLFVPFFAIGFVHVWRYASRVRATPSASLLSQRAEHTSPLKANTESLPHVTARHVIILALVLITLAVLVWGITRYGWYLVELGAVFTALAIVAGLVAGISLNDLAKTFTTGAAELTGTALLIGFARAIELLLNDGQVLHTIIDALATPLSNVSGGIAASGMLVIQSIFNLFIPSGSGQAYVTMPIMAPISDIVGLARQVAVLAYQMGDGFMNMIVPTSYVLMGILGMAQVPYDRWVRFIWPLILQLLAAGCIALFIAVAIGYS